MKQLLRSPLFIIGLAIKIIFLFFMGSHYLKDLFIPFLDQAVLHPMENPWAISPPHFFPYGSVLFMILFIPRLIAYKLFGLVALGTGPLGLALVKAPLLCMDIALLFTLTRFAKTRSHKLLVFYWLNPVLFYISYVHGQLDLVATCFCLLSLYFLTVEKVILSALTLGAATLCKFHVVAIIPFMLAFFWNREFLINALKNISTWIIAWGTITILGFLPHILSGKFFYSSTASPEAFRLFATQIDFGSGQTLYIGIGLVLIMLGRLCISSRITDLGLLFGAGSIFGSILLSTNTMPGWYFWVMPFICLFFTLYLNVPQILFWGFNVAYLFYFALLPSIHFATGNLIFGISFTLLQTLLGGIIIALWVTALRHESALSGRMKPVIMGISGDSGAGKNHLSQLLSHLFNDQNTIVIEGDDYHKWERASDFWNNYTHLNPKANHLAKMANHTSLLSRGMPVLQRHYNHITGEFTQAREIKPTKTIIVQGLHALYLQGMRKELDLKIHLNPHDSIRLAWKIKRDVRERGHSVQKVYDSLSKRSKDSRTHIEPQKYFADWVIEYLPTETFTDEEIIAGKEIQIISRHWLWNDAPIIDLIDVLSDLPNCKVSVTIVPNDINRIMMTVSGTPTLEEIQYISKQLFPNLRNITRGQTEPCFYPGQDGVNQLIALSLLNGKLMEKHPS